MTVEKSKGFSLYSPWKVIPSRREGHQNPKWHLSPNLTTDIWQGTISFHLACFLLALEHTSAWVITPNAAGHALLPQSSQPWIHKILSGSTDIPSYGQTCTLSTKVATKWRRGARKQANHRIVQNIRFHIYGFSSWTKSYRMFPGLRSLLRALWRCTLCTHVCT